MYSFTYAYNTEIHNFKRLCSIYSYYIKIFAMCPVLYSIALEPKTVTLSTYAMACRFPGTGDKAVSRRDIVPFLMEFTFVCQPGEKGAA